MDRTRFSTSTLRLICLLIGAGCLGSPRLARPDTLPSNAVPSTTLESTPPRAPAATRPPPWRWNSDTPGLHYHAYAAAAGDVNGDGLADVLVSEPGFDRKRGRALLWYGAREGLPAQPAWTIEGDAHAPREVNDFHAVGAGDLNGDGCGDVLVLRNYTALGKPSPDDLVEIFFGATNGLARQAGWRLRPSEIQADQFLLVGRAGNLDRDPHADFWVLAIASVGSGPPRFVAHIFHGARDGPAKTPRVILDLAKLSPRRFPALAAAGDVNRDGYDDLLFGDPEWSGPAEHSGRVLLFLGSPQGLLTNAAWTATCELPLRHSVDSAQDQLFGWSVAGAGDVNRDGYADILVGAPYAEQGDVNEGLAFIYHGGPKGPGTRPDWIIQGNHSYALLGYAVSGGGDINGDGFADVLIGVPSASHDQINEGAALVYLGSRKGLRRALHWVTESDRSNEYLGRCVAIVGDVNGDGCADFLVAAPKAEQGTGHAAQVRLYYGNRAGLSGPSGWRNTKPPLLALQQHWNRAGAAWKLGGLAALMVLAGGLFIAWRRALARLRLAAREAARAQERERLARDLHDHLGARLSQIARWAKIARSAPAADPPQREPLDRIAEITATALRGVREFVENLAPTSATLADFADHLADVAQETLEATNLRLDLPIPPSLPDLKLAAEARSHLVLFVREALRNILQHARASRVTLTLGLDRDTLRLALEDDGQGFDPAALPAANHQAGNGGHGLKNLQARAAALGGHLEIHSRPGAGARLTLTAPLRNLRAPGNGD